MDILNDEGMKRARELSREMARVSNIEENEAMKTITDFLHRLKQTVTNVWNHIKDTFNDIAELVYEKKNKKEHLYNWHVPKDTTRVSQVIIPNVNIPRIRNYI